MPEIRTLEITSQEIAKGDTLWGTADLFNAGVKPFGVNIEVEKKNVATKYVWVNDKVRLPKDVVVHVSRSFETEAEIAAKQEAYDRKSMETFVEGLRAYEGNTPLLQQMAAGTTRVSWDSLSSLVASTAKATVTAQFLHALEVVTEKKGDEFDLLVFAAEYADYLTERLMQSYGFKSTSKSSNVMSNVMDEAEREWQAKMVEALRGSRWSF